MLVRAAADTETQLRARIAELEQQLAAVGGVGVAASPKRDGGKFTRHVSNGGDDEDGHTERADHHHHSIVNLQKLRGAYLQLAMEVPDVQLQDFLQTEPCYRKDLPGMSLAHVNNMFLMQDFLGSVMHDDIGAYDMVSSRWQTGVKVPSTVIRGFKYKVPVPDDVPGAIKKLVTLPPFGLAKTFMRMSSSESQVLLTMQSITEGFPIGENLRLQVTDAFTPLRGGSGVTFRRWVVVMWIKELPWHMRIIKSFVVSEAMSRSRAAADVMLSRLRTGS